MNNPDGSGGFFPRAGPVAGFNTTTMAPPGVAQYIQSLIYQIPELQQAVEAHDATLQHHSEIMGHTQSKYNELAAQVIELTTRVSHLEQEECKTSKNSAASAILAKDVKKVQKEVEGMRGQLSELQNKAVQYERTLKPRGAVDTSPGSQDPSSRPKLPAEQATSREIPTGPSSMHQPNHPHSAQDINAMNNRLIELVHEGQGVHKGQPQSAQGQRPLASYPAKSATVQSNQLVKQSNNGKLVVRDNTLPEKPACRTEGYRSSMVTACRERVLRDGRAQIEAYCTRYDKEIDRRGSGRRGNPENRFVFVQTVKLNQNMNYWNCRILNALDQLSMAGREEEAINVVKNLLDQMERSRLDRSRMDRSRMDRDGQFTKNEVPFEGIELIKRWFSWTDKLFDELRPLHVLDVPGVCSTELSNTLTRKSAGQPKINQSTIGTKRRMESPLRGRDNSKRQVPSSFNSPTKRRAVSPASSPFSTTGTKKSGADLFSSGSTKKSGADIFKSFTKRRAHSPPLSDAEIAMRHADSFLKSLDIQEAAFTYHSSQHRGSRTEPHHGGEYHRESDYYGPGSNIKGDFYPDMPIQGRDYRRGGGYV